MLQVVGMLFASLILSLQAQPLLSLRVTSGADLELSWATTNSGYSLEQTATLSPAEWVSLNLVPVVQGNQYTVPLKAAAEVRFFRLSQGLADPTGIESTSPFDGEAGVAVTRESIVRFSAPLEINTMLNAENFYAMSLGRKILSRAEISSDRKQVTLFYLEPLPGGARVDVFLDPEDLLDFQGRPLDRTDFAQNLSIFSFTTLSLTPLVQTAVIGTVFASEFAGGNGTNGANRPLAGVTVTVDGMEQTLRAVTDENGKFKLSPVPPGRFFVHIDGRTAVDDALGIRYPDKAYYPFVGKAWEAVAGREDNLAGGTGEIFLPLIIAGTLQAVSQTVPTTISFPPEVVASNPALAGVSITVPANALFSDNGARGGKVGIAPVAPDRLPGPLPPGLELPIVITVQTDGPLNFDQPAPICFPNVTDPVLGTPLPAGSKQSLVSFNHKKGVWEAVGTMTVSADGKLVCSDPGSGILQPGWHGGGAPPQGPPPPPCGGEAAASLGMFRSLENGRIVALDAASCKMDCGDTKARRDQSAEVSFNLNMRACFNFKKDKCDAKNVYDVRTSDLEVNQSLYEDCLKGCTNAPPPPPPPPPPPKNPPKKPKSCRKPKRIPPQ